MQDNIDNLVEEDSRGDEVVTLNPLARGFYDRIVLAVDTTAAYGNLSNWLEKNTMIEDRPFSFKDHECHIAIVNDTSRRVVVQKCSQVGVSELSVRRIIGVTATSRGSHSMYVMPTVNFAKSFSTSRIQPVIDGSEVVSAMTGVGASKSALLKKIGTSYLHIGGTAGSTSGAISVPAKQVVFDEYDFCDMRVAGQYESRLKHAPECPETNLKGWVTKFSTPTLPNFGINKEFEASDQKHYHVKCKCGYSFAPNYSRDIKIPNAPKDFDIKSLTAEDINSEVFEVKKAYIACPKCDRNVWEELCDPSKREWVPKFPGRSISGYQIHPWDVPKVNSVPSILMQIAGYENPADFYNFTVGIPYEDKENAFSSSPLIGGKRCIWNDVGGTGYYLGCDVGRTSNIVIGKPVHRTKLSGEKLEVHYMERFRTTKTKTLDERLCELIKRFGVRCAVIDSQPDFSVINKVARKFPTRTFGCEYQENRPAEMTTTKKSTNLSNIAANPDTHIVKAYRTGTLNELLYAHNDGEILYPIRSLPDAIIETDVAAENFKNIKKVRKPDKLGGAKETYIKLDGNDHYVHAMNYLRMAVEIKNEVSKIGVVGAPVTVASVNLNPTNHKPAILIGSEVNALTRSRYPR